MITFIELFAGIGGFRKGLEATNNFKYVWANEWDKYANSVYRKNYGECDARDLRTIRADEIPEADMLVGGFPCQSFSIAGKRGGFEDTRGTLFFEIIRIAKEKRPSILLLENVRGLLNHEQGRTFATIISALDEIGYNVQWEVLNTKNFGIPQSRERVFIIATARERGFKQIFPLEKSNARDLKKIQERFIIRGRNKNASGCLDTRGVNRYGRADLDNLIYAIPVLTPERKEKRQNGRRFKEHNDPMFTLTAQDKHGIFDGYDVRRLTPIERERLQGFPDDWTAYGHDRKEMSDTQRYKMCGNAVSTNVIREIGERISDEMD
jgi:DNA (cytosine-5)-methyltransferase 1